MFFYPKNEDAVVVVVGIEEECARLQHTANRHILRIVTQTCMHRIPKVVHVMFDANGGANWIPAIVLGAQSNNSRVNTTAATITTATTTVTATTDKSCQHHNNQKDIKETETERGRETEREKEMRGIERGERADR